MARDIITYHLVATVAAVVAETVLNCPRHTDCMCDYYCRTKGLRYDNT